MEVAAFHPPPCDRRRLVSVALFLAFASAARPRLLRPGVTRHPALWSPDFPLPSKLALRRQRRSGRLRSPHCRGFPPVAPAYRLRHGSVACAAGRGTAVRSECATAGLSLRQGAVARAAGRGMAVRSECAPAGLRVPVRHRSRTSCRQCCDRGRSPHHPRRPSRTLALAMPRPAARNKVVAHRHAPTRNSTDAAASHGTRWRVLAKGACGAVVAKRVVRQASPSFTPGRRCPRAPPHRDPLDDETCAAEARSENPHRVPLADARMPTRACRRAHADARMPRYASAVRASYVAATSPTRQRSSSPARSGTIDPSPNGNDSGTREGTRCSVIDSRLRGRP
jgi:hypothetical protein